MITLIYRALFFHILHFVYNIIHNTKLIFKHCLKTFTNYFIIRSVSIPHRKEIIMILHSILIYILVVIIFVFALVYLGVLWIIGLFNKKIRDAGAFYFTVYGSRFLLFACGAKVSYSGLENLSCDRPVLYVCNHRSIFDILLTYSVLTRQTGFVAKKQLKKIPVLNFLMVFLHCTFIDRQNPREGIKAIFDAIENIKLGKSMFIFPEGTRNKNPDFSDLLPFHDGSFKIAQRGKCPVVPIAIKNSDGIFEKHIPFVRTTTVSFTVGEPVDLGSLEGDNKKHPGKYFSKIISEMLMN